MEIDLEQANAALQGKSPQEIIRWALDLGEPVIASTSFSPNSGALLHMLCDVDPSVPVVWVDSGYNMPDAYRVAEKLMQRLPLNMHVYTPLMTAERRNALMGGIPHPDDDAELHREFTRQVKLEPFQRALAEFKPKIWITGIRKEETAFRQSLDILSFDARGLLRVGPVFQWSEEQLSAYMAEHDLPSCKHYFDPTKVDDKRECGLHTAA